MMKTIMLVLLMVTLSACAVDDTQSTDQPLSFTEKDFGQTVTIKQGDVITIKLKENPTTGYLWGVEKNDMLSKIFDNYSPSGRFIVGSGGIRTLKFRTTTKGNTELKLKYWREWEGDASILRRFQIKVIVN